tara:strand:- start:117910 stop:119025 length:1116 start_codon:yes stop_codon:yes gene_type:complete
MSRTSRVSNPLLSEHFSELNKLFFRSSLSLLFAIIIWAFYVDNILDTWTSIITPSSALSIYGPYDWLEIRWTAILILSVVSILPIICYEIRRFTLSGLTKKEKIWLNSYLLISVLMIPFILYVTWFISIPEFINHFSRLESIDGINNRYDAKEIFSLASGFSWIIIITFLSTLSVSLINFFGFSEKEKSYFSTRIFLICGGILILTLPSVFEGIRVTIALTSISIAFLISRTTPRVSLRRHHLNIQNLVGSSGDSQRIALLDCSCEGACPSLSTNQISGGSFLGIANLSCKALCLEVEEQYSLMQLANTENLSKIVITGCDGTPLPFLMKNKLNKIGTNIEGLQWLNLPANVSEDWLNKSLEDYFSDLQVE